MKKKLQVWWVNKLYSTNWNRIILYSIIGLAIIPWFVILKISRENFPYILSSLSQGLAAIITILITVLIVTLQMSEKYRYINLIFDWKTYLLILFYIIAITVPLFVLKTYISSLWLNISIDLGIIALGFLFIFIKRILNIIKFGIGIPKLTDRMYNERDLHNFPLYEDILTDIGYLTQNIPPKIAGEYFEVLLSLKVKLIYKIRLWIKELPKIHEVNDRYSLNNIISTGIGILFNLWESYKKNESNTDAFFDDILDFYGEVISILNYNNLVLSVKQTISAVTLIGIISIIKNFQETFEKSITILKDSTSSLSESDNTTIYILSLGFWLLGISIYKEFSDEEQKRKQIIKYLFENMFKIKETSFIEDGYTNTKKEITEGFTKFGLFSIIPSNDKSMLTSSYKITEKLTSLFTKKDLGILEKLKKNYDKYRKEKGLNYPQNMDENKSEEKPHEIF